MIRSELSGAPETSEDVNIHNSTGNEIFIRALIGIAPEHSLLAGGFGDSAFKSPLGNFENTQCLIGCVEMIWIKYRDPRLIGS